MCSGCTQPALGGSGPLCRSTSSQSGGKIAGLPMQENHSDCSRVAKHPWVWGHSGHVEPNPIVPAQYADTTIQLHPSQEPVKPESLCLVSRSSAFKEQGLSETVEVRIEAQQRVSTRSVHEATLTIFTKG